MTTADADLVRPHYRALLGTNALRLEESTRRAVVSAGRRVDADDVVRLLESAQWRAVVVGAWFSLAVPSSSVESSLLHATAESRGSLAALPLATVATLVSGDAAVPALRRFADGPCGRDDSSARFAQAAVDHLDGRSTDAVTADDRESLARMLAVARELRRAWT